ncbi:MAG: hypothetical protein ACYCQJ_14140 [Nitrososphaerales archaeon]
MILDTIPKRPAFETELEYLIQVWMFLKENIGESLLSLQPTTISTPGVWILRRNSPLYKKHREFVLEHFPSHHVLDVSGTQSEC